MERHRFTAEFKREAVRLMERGDKPVAQLALGKTGVRFTYPGVVRARAGSPPPLACGAWDYTARHDAFSPCRCPVVDAVRARSLGCGASFRSATSPPVRRA